MNSIDALREGWATTATKEFFNNLGTYVPNLTFLSDNSGTAAFLDSIQQEDGKTIKVGDKIYKVTCNINNYDTQLANIPVTSAVGRGINKIFYDAKKYWANTFPNLTPLSYPEQMMGDNTIIWCGITYTLTIAETSSVNTTEFTYDFSNTDVSNLETPYGIICMPYDDNFKVADDNGTDIGLDKVSRIKIMQALGSVSNLLYDIQLLPYCPVQNLFISSNNVINISQSGNIKTVPVKSGDTHFCSLIVAPTASISFKIYNTITVYDIKMQNDTDMWRLCSPNYAGNFDFNATKFYSGSNNTIN